MLGFMTDKGSISWALLLSIFVANFPESFGGTALLRASGMHPFRIVALWSSICLMTGVLAAVGAMLLPSHDRDVGAAEGDLHHLRKKSTAAMEGFAGGAMMAMVSTAMLPEAFRATGDVSGFFVAAGFIATGIISILDAYLHLE